MGPHMKRRGPPIGGCLSQVSLDVVLLYVSVSYSYYRKRHGSPTGYGCPTISSHKDDPSTMRGPCGEAVSPIGGPSEGLFSHTKPGTLWFVEPLGGHIVDPYPLYRRFPRAPYAHWVGAGVKRSLGYQGLTGSHWALGTLVVLVWALPGP